MIPSTLRGLLRSAQRAPEGNTPEDDATSRALRDALVQELLVLGDLVTPSVVEAFRAVPRHVFCPSCPVDEAYANVAVPIGYEQTLSQPSVVALMTEALALSGHERVLEIGTGSGYQTAILSLLAREVYTVERVGVLAREARARLMELGRSNVEVRAGDGYEGWPERAPFDRVVVTAAPPELPGALVDQLASGGVLVVPIGPQDPGGQSLMKLRKDCDRLVRQELGSVYFVEMRRGSEAS